MTVLMPWERLGGKVTSCQTGRLAVIYVRQSTKQQVIGHSESTRLQYALVDRAAAMGWAAARIIVIDDDLGKSGSSAVDRAGFQRLVTEISLGHVGLVLGTEMSRLARSGKDWYQLIELCALAGALLADLDGVYDPVQYNDRLLLGLKGTMSAAELHLIKQRMQAGRVNKARRGEMAIALPAGYARRASGEAAFDPDEQVQAVVRLVFAKFAEIGTVQGVMRYLVEQGVEMGIRMRSGPLKGEIVWKRPARATITCMLHSPIYAGIYAYGRRRVDPLRQRPGHPGSGLRGHAEDEWLARIEGALPAYISVGQYRANLARLAANDPRADTPGAVRYGPALLAGLLRCGRCARRMTVTYHVDNGVPRISYDCTGARAEYGGPACQHLSGRCLDVFVTGQVADDHEIRLCREFCDRGNAGCKMTRLRSRSKPARPYIWRLIILILLTVPSTLPEFQCRVRPLVTAFWSWRMPVARERSPAWSSASTAVSQASRSRLPVRAVIISAKAVTCPASASIPGWWP